MGPVWLRGTLFVLGWECFEVFCMKALEAVSGLAALGWVLSLS